MNIEEIKQIKKDNMKQIISMLLNQAFSEGFVCGKYETYEDKDIDYLINCASQYIQEFNISL